MTTRETGIARFAPMILAALIACATALVAAPSSAAPPPGSPGAPILDPASRAYAHVRVTATANSGWAVATFSGVEIIDHVLVSGQSGVTVTPTAFGWVMGTGTSPPVVLDMLISAPPGAAVSLATIKGDAGTFTVDIDSVSTTGVMSDAFEHVNSQIDVPGHNPLTTSGWS